MNARKIDLAPYPVLVDSPDGTEPVGQSYDVRRSLVNLLFNPQLNLSAYALLEHHKLAEKISELVAADCADGSILLEQADYQKLVHAVEVFRGFSKNDVELVRRVLEAPSVNVGEMATSPNP